MRIRLSQIVAFYGVCFKLLNAYHTVWRFLSDAILSNYVTFSILKYVNTSLLTSEVYNMNQNKVLISISDDDGYFHACVLFYFLIMP